MLPMVVVRYLRSLRGLKEHLVVRPSPLHSDHGGPLRLAGDDSGPHVQPVAALADAVRADAELRGVLDLLIGKPDSDLATELTRLSCRRGLVANVSGLQQRVAQELECGLVGSGGKQYEAVGRVICARRLADGRIADHPTADGAYGRHPDGKQPISRPTRQRCRFIKAVVLQGAQHRAAHRRLRQMLAAIGICPLAAINCRDSSDYGG